MPDSTELPREEHTSKISLPDAATPEVTLPEDIIGELKELDDRFTDSADRAIMKKYESIGAIQFLERVPKDELINYIHECGPAIRLNTMPVRDSKGAIIAYDVYRENPNAIIESPDEIARIDKLSDDFMSEIRAEKLKLLDAAVLQGRATDLGEMSLNEWVKLPDEVLENSVTTIYLYDANGVRLDKVRVYRVHKN